MKVGKEKKTAILLENFGKQFHFWRTWAIRSDQSALRLAHQRVLNTDHVVLWNTLGDAHNQRYLGFERFQNGSSCTWRRNLSDERRTNYRLVSEWPKLVKLVKCITYINHRCIGIGSVASLANGAEHGQAQVLLAGLFRRHAADNLGAIVQRLLAMERALFAGEALHDDFGVGGQAQVLPGRLVQVWIDAVVARRNLEAV